MRDIATKLCFFGNPSFHTAARPRMKTSFFSTQIRYFLEVARTGSVSQAAGQLHVAASAVSRQIAKLEDQLGCALFERRARGMVPRMRASA